MNCGCSFVPSWVHAPTWAAAPRQSVFGSGWSGVVVVGLFQQLGQFVSPLELLNAVLSLDGILHGCGRVHLLLLQPSCKSFSVVWLLLDRSTPSTGVFVLGVCNCSGCIYPPSES